MKLQQYIKSKGETWYSITLKLVEGTPTKKNIHPRLCSCERCNELNHMKQKIMRYLKNDDLTLSQYQLFATALKMKVGDLLIALGRL